jgi:hypothetical protein
MSAVDYNKKTFTDEEKDILLKESVILRNEYPDKVSILIQVASDVLGIEKYKFLVSGDINVEYFFDSLKKKITGLSDSDTLVISVTTLTGSSSKKVLKPVLDTTSLLKDFYEKNMDPETNMLIFTVSRQTTYKWLKGGVRSVYKYIW